MSGQVAGEWGGESVFSAGSRAADYIEEDPIQNRPPAHPDTWAPTRRDTWTATPVAPSTTADDAAGSSALAVPLVTGMPAAVEPAPVTAARLEASNALLPSSTEGLRAAARQNVNQWATTGGRGFLARLGFPVEPSKAEQAERAAAAQRDHDESIVRQTTWTRPVAVLVANPKGGTGKTPAALLLGGVLASIRGGSVAVVEVSDDPGALTFRAEGNPQLGVGELVRDASRITNAGQLAGYTAPQTSFAHVIGSVGRRERLTGDAIVAVTQVIGQHYGITVMDSGNQPTSSAFQGAVEVADALVLPVMNAGDSVLEVIRLLEELRAAGGQAADLSRRAIAVELIDGRPENQAVREEVTRLLRDAGIEQVFQIPYDAHIAQRGQLTLSELAPATRTAFVRTAAAVVTSLQRSHHTATPRGAHS